MNRRAFLLIVVTTFSCFFFIIFSWPSTGSDFPNHISASSHATENSETEAEKERERQVTQLIQERESTSPSPSSQKIVKSTAWNAEESLFDSQLAAKDSMKFTNSAMEQLRRRSNQFVNVEHLDQDPDHFVGRRQTDILAEKKCNAERFLFVNTHTFGRHHNQLQEILHTVAFARRLNRTAVLGYFRAGHKWWGPGDFYDFDLLVKRECVVTPSEFRSLWSTATLARRRRSAGEPTAVCLGQGTKATPLAKAVKCTMEPSIPAHYNSKTGFASTKDSFYGKIMLEKPSVVSADFLGISGEIAFFMRPGFLEMARLLAAIKPSMGILAELRSFYRTSGLSPNPEIDRFWGISSAANVPSSLSGQYFALHLRQREKDCLKEVNDALELNPDLLKKLGPEQAQAIRTQCAIPVSHVEDNLFKRYGIPIQDTRFFLASDHENVVLEKALVETRGAVMYSGSKFEHKSLQGLAMDFFLLVGAKYFSGNQLSSISQNVCMMRLGHGLSGCHGCVLDYALQLYNPIDEVW